MRSVQYHTIVCRDDSSIHTPLLVCWSVCCCACDLTESAVRLSQMGFLVFATVHKQSDLDLLNKHTINNLVPLQLDINSKESCEAAVTTVREKLATSGHRLLGIVLNAGYAVSSPLELVPLDVGQHTA